MGSSRFMVLVVDNGSCKFILDATIVPNIDKIGPVDLEIASSFEDGMELLGSGNKFDIVIGHSFRKDQMSMDGYAFRVAEIFEAARKTNPKCDLVVYTTLEQDVKDFLDKVGFDDAKVVGRGVIGGNEKLVSRVRDVYMNAIKEGLQAWLERASAQTGRKCAGNKNCNGHGFLAFGRKPNFIILKSSLKKALRVIGKP